MLAEAPKATKSIQQGDSTSKSEKGAYLSKNDSKANSEVREDLNVLSADKISPLKPLSNSQQYNIALNQDKGLNDSNFITLGKISEEDKIQIIQTEFRLSQEGKISLKKYYESKDPDSLFQWKKYSIKYESVRQSKLYKKLKNEIKIN